MPAPPGNPPPGIPPELIKFLLAGFLLVLGYQFISSLLLKKRLEEGFSRLARRAEETTPPLPLAFNLEKALGLIENQEKLLNLIPVFKGVLAQVFALDSKLLFHFALNLAKQAKGKGLFLLLVFPQKNQELIGEGLLRLEKSGLSGKSALKPYEKNLFLAVDFPITPLDLYDKIRELKGKFQGGLVLLEASALGESGEADFIFNDLKRVSHREEVPVLIFSEKPLAFGGFELTFTLKAQGEKILLTGSAEQSFSYQPESGELKLL